MTKQVMTLAVPGIVVCIEKRRCIAVVVKNVNMIIRLIEFEFFKQYFAIAWNVLLKEKYKFRLRTVKTLLSNVFVSEQGHKAVASVQPTSWNIRYFLRFFSFLYKGVSMKLYDILEPVFYGLERFIFFPKTKIIVSYFLPSSFRTQCKRDSR